MDLDKEGVFVHIQVLGAVLDFVVEFKEYTSESTCTTVSP